MPPPPHAARTAWGSVPLTALRVHLSVCLPPAAGGRSWPAPPASCWLGGGGGTRSLAFCPWRRAGVVLVGAGVLSVGVVFAVAVRASAAVVAAWAGAAAVAARFPPLGPPWWGAV